LVSTYRGVEGQDLIVRCRTGDHRAWATVVGNHAGLVNGLLRGAYRLEPHDAEDAFQEVFTRLYLRLGDLREERALPGWIAQVTRNVALDLIRSRKRELVSDELDEGSFHEPEQRVLEAMSVRQALARLPEQQREMLDRFFVQDQSYRTIAAELSIPAGTVASRISRALVMLREDLREENPVLERHSLHE
jgi:RNA polymerase sigma-70 factor (ECF subfamily)